MKKLYRLFMMLMLAMLTVACSDDDDAALDSVITITTSEFTIAPEQDSQAKALFNINVDWTASISYEGEAKDWLTATPTSGGAGDVEIVMKGTANTSDMERKAFVTINYEGGSHKLTITQTIKGDIDITAHFDAKFAAKLQEKGYIPNAKKILLSDVIDITEVDVSETNSMKTGELTSLAGIEYFKSLTHLSCFRNEITTLDISKNTALTWLWCFNNQLTELDVSKNTALTYLSCDDNQFATLDISMNTELTNLSCGSKELTTLDTSKNTKLTDLNCGNSRLITLDVSKNTALTYLYCAYNQLTTLDVSKNTKLADLWCNDNQLTTLDVSKNTALTKLSFHTNPGIEGKFVVKAWFDNNSVPSLGLFNQSWHFNERYITVDYQKVSL